MTMLVRDVMSVRLICAGLSTPIQQAARTIVRNRIGGMPVVDDEGYVKGIISESDLQPLKEALPGRPLRTVADMMTTPVITLTEGDTVTQAARVLRRHHVKRAPVVREGRVVGMITQSDLLRPLLRTDSELRVDVEEALVENGVSQHANVAVRVQAGIVFLEGIVVDRRQAAILARLARGIDGVIDVQDLMRLRQAAS